MTLPRRYLNARDLSGCRPVNVVWELTLACDLKCSHCGSRAGRPRAGELTTAECLDLVEQLARLGTREIGLIGGEAYLRSDWIEIVRAIRSAGMDCSIQTGGRNLSEERVAAASAAGVQSVGVSIDGLSSLHDALRGVVGSFDLAIAALRRCRANGITISVNTQITSRVAWELEALLDVLIEEGVSSWQVALTVPMGRAADRPELLLQPYQLLRLMPLLAALHRRAAEHGVVLQPANNIGYFGPYESQFRSSNDPNVYFGGCDAGQNVLGIEADGSIKGCPGLPSEYIGGNIRTQPLAEIWRRSERLAFTRLRTVDDLWGFCRDCYYADVCLGGCTWMAHSLLGRPGNNPYCHYRALELAKRGLGERVVKRLDAPGQPFDHGEFELTLEPLTVIERRARWEIVSA
jgi:radical SAM protein with 4Fe4S-binding SPASM domain